MPANRAPELRYNSVRRSAPSIFSAKDRIQMPRNLAASLATWDSRVQHAQQPTINQHRPSTQIASFQLPDAPPKKRPPTSKASRDAFDKITTCDDNAMNDRQRPTKRGQPRPRVCPRDCAQGNGAALARGPLRRLGWKRRAVGLLGAKARPTGVLASYETLTSIFFGCDSGRLVIVTCSTPLASSAVIVEGSTVSGSETLRVTLPKPRSLCQFVRSPSGTFRSSVICKAPLSNVNSTSSRATPGASSSMWNVFSASQIEAGARHMATSSLRKK